MNLKVSQSVLSGSLTIPGSKSHTIRAVAIACLAKGVSTIINPLESDDTLSALETAIHLGAKVHKEKNQWIIEGTSGHLRNPQQTLNLGNSGTSLRLFTAIAGLADFRVIFDGDNSLRTRLMDPLLNALQSLKVDYSSSANDGHCPLWVKGPLQGGKCHLIAESSQFLSALLIATPLAPYDTEIDLLKLNEKPYVQITLDWLDRLGIQYQKSDDLMYFKVFGRQHYTAFNRTIPADFSTATFPLIAALVTRGKIDIYNLDFSDSQGDQKVFDIVKKMGAKIEYFPDFIRVDAENNQLHGEILDLNDIPDSLPALAVLACYAKGRTQIINTPQARIKETDRIACMTHELNKMGATIIETPDGMIIDPPKNGLIGTSLNGYSDHRIVMALAIAGMGAHGQTTVSTAESAAVTYPNFISDFAQLGIKWIQ